MLLKTRGKALPREFTETRNPTTNPQAPTPHLNLRHGLQLESDPFQPVVGGLPRSDGSISRSSPRKTTAFEKISSQGEKMREKETNDPLQ